AIAKNRIKPLDTNGQSDPENGVIILLSLGPCNAWLEFGTAGDTGDGFKPRADGELAKNPKVVIFNGAAPSQDAQKWATLPTGFTNCGGTLMGPNPWVDA